MPRQPQSRPLGPSVRYQSMRNQKTFRLSAEQTQYISTLILENEEFENLLPDYLSIGRNLEVLILNQVDAEQLRDYFTDRLARVGFDEKYEPNKEGLLLEELADLLFVPGEQWASE